MTQAERSARYRERHPERIAIFQKKQYAKYYAENKEKIIAYVTKWQKENKEKRVVIRKTYNDANRTKIAESSERYKKAHPERAMLGRARVRARRNGMDFDIEESDVFIPEFCPHLGIPISGDSKSVDFRPSLDRIDSSKGYVKGNIMVISHRANRLKNDSNGYELLSIAISLLRMDGVIE